MFQLGEQSQDDLEQYQVQHTVEPSPYKDSRLIDNSLPRNISHPDNQESFNGSQFFSDDQSMNNPSAFQKLKTVGGSPVKLALRDNNMKMHTG